jgi:hypothetical protein
MAGPDTPSDRIRALIEEVDRVCRESESVTSGIDESMKRSAFYPDRRKHPRFPSTGSGASERDDST